MTKKQKKMVLRILISAAALAPLHFLQVDGFVRLGLYLIPYLIAGYDILLDAARGIRNRQVLDENFLMAIATVGALALGILDTGDYNEAVLVMVLYQTGELFQSYAVGKSRKSISALMDIRPDYANVEQDGQLVQLDPEKVEIGSIITVLPGEKVPIDGVVAEGCSSLDTASLTGESLPRDVSPGDPVISGCINLNGLLKIRTSKDFSESTVSKILELVENASSNKASSEKFITKFARFYTPAVCAAAMALTIFPPLVSLALGGKAGWSTWLYRGLTFLVASCPCALVISIPLTFFAGIGGASQAGILVKGSNYLETLAQVKTLVFDKTGTLTQGVFQVSSIEAEAVCRNTLLEMAAHAESGSNHPVSRCIQNAYGKPIDRQRVTQLQEHFGKGITAQVDGIRVAAGNEKLMDAEQVAFIPCNKPGTVVYVAIGGKFAGNILISDQLKPSAGAAIRALQKIGIGNCVMLTGDNAGAAAAIAEDLGIKRYHAQLLPGQKVHLVEQLLRENAGKLAFVGDGINDAPVLSRADIGIAMGAMGSDAAIEAADVVLMRDDPMQIVKAIGISKLCRNIVYQNIVFSIVIKLLSLVLVAAGVAGMGLAIFADVGVMVLAVLNATRALIKKG